MKAVGKKKDKPTLPPLPPLPEKRTPFQLQKYARQHPDRCWFWPRENGDYVLCVDDIEVARTSEPWVDEEAYEPQPGEYLLDPDEGFQSEDDGDPNQRMLF